MCCISQKKNAADPSQFGLRTVGGLSLRFPIQIFGFYSNRTEDKNLFRQNRDPGLPHKERSRHDLCVISHIIQYNMTETLQIVLKTSWTLNRTPSRSRHLHLRSRRFDLYNHTTTSLVRTYMTINVLLQPRMSL